MGEGTKVFNVQTEIKLLKKRLDLLEQKPAPFNPCPVIPVTSPQGCVCPAGAERSCGNTFCPRRHYPGTYW